MGPRPDGLDGIFLFAIKPKTAIINPYNLIFTDMDAQNVIKAYYEETEGQGQLPSGQIVRELTSFSRKLIFNAHGAVFDEEAFNEVCIDTSLGAEELEAELTSNPKNNPLVQQIIAIRERLGIASSHTNIELRTLSGAIVDDRFGEFSHHSDRQYQRREVTTSTPLSAKALRALLEILKPREADPERTVREKPKQPK